MKAFDAGGVPPITFGVGRLEHAGTIAARLGKGPVLVVADEVLDSLGVTARLTASLENAMAVQNRVGDHPPWALTQSGGDRSGLL